jgi:hypothetical protein
MADGGAAISVRSLSPPELALARVLHLKWPKSGKLDFGWKRVGVRGVAEPSKDLNPSPHPSPYGRLIANAV